MGQLHSIRVLLADDHGAIRAGLAHIVQTQQDMQVAGVAENGLEAVKLARSHPDAHVMLLDIALPDKSGLEVLKQIRKDNPFLQVLMFSMYREDQYAMRCLKAGAAGYLSKEAEPEEIVAALRQVAGGQKYISAQLAQELARSLGEGHNENLHEGLSDREYQTLTMIASGKTVSTIAKELSLSVKTISEYRSRLLLKMKLKNSAELTHYAIKHHLVE
ncbi:response regulator transcription factor [Massilia sp. W12]|uniref:response regulator transcription factor n=1 Tax=Massilia sp. W12 TaxID=3126507 RepID=UPI0030D0CE16